MTADSRVIRYAALLAIALTTVIIYLPGIAGPFVFDDLQNIVTNRAIAIDTLSTTALHEAARSGPGLGRPLAMITFALNYYVAGGLDAPVVFKITNLAIHLANTLLIYILARLLTGRLSGNAGDRGSRSWVPAITALLWAVHPLQVTAVLYTVQRMTSLSALFVLAGLILFVHGRSLLETDDSRAKRYMSIGLLAGLGLGTACKENAALIVLLAPIIEYVFFSRASLSTHARRWLAGLYVVTLGAPLLAGALWLVFRPESITADYALREFSLSDRLLTQSRVLWFYLSLLVVPDIRAFTLYHDDILPSTGFLSPWTTAPAITGIALVLVLAIKYRARWPLFAFAVLWFFIGHSMESGVIALELAHEHRNYLPSMGLFFAASAALHRLTTRGTHPVITRAIIVSIAALFAMVTALRAQAWATDERLIRQMAANHPASPRSQAMLGELLVGRHGDLYGGARAYQRAITLAPHEPAFVIRLATLVGSVQLSPAAPFTSDEARQVQEELDAAGLSLIVVHREHVSPWLGVQPALIQEADEHLRTGPVTLQVPDALRTLVHCITTDKGNCRLLVAQAIAWHQALANNPRAARDFRESALRGLFEIGVSAGHYQLALDTADRGLQLYPASGNFALMRIDALALLGRHRDARNTLERIAADPRIAIDHQQAIDALRERLRAHARQSKDLRTR